MPDVIVWYGPHERNHGKANLRAVRCGMAGKRVLKMWSAWSHIDTLLSLLERLTGGQITFGSIVGGITYISAVQAVPWWVAAPIALATVALLLFILDKLSSRGHEEIVAELRVAHTHCLDMVDWAMKHQENVHRAIARTLQDIQTNRAYSPAEADRIDAQDRALFLRFGGLNQLRSIVIARIRRLRKEMDDLHRQHDLFLSVSGHAMVASKTDGELKIYTERVLPIIKELGHKTRAMRDKLEWTIQAYLR